MDAWERYDDPPVVPVASWGIGAAMSHSGTVQLLES